MESSFGEFLKQRRQEKKLTQKELAKRLIVSESAVSKWEKDVARPDITLLPKISEILEVTEHELITASIDHQARDEKIQARKWRIFSNAWDLFFYISYIVALIPCFICNLAIGKTLSWFWIVFAALLLAFTFTNLPRLIKRNKLLWLPLSMFSALCILLGIIAIYVKGDWFLIASTSVLLGLLIVFLPIYISKYAIFSRIKKYADFVSVFVDFIVLNILLIIIDVYCVVNAYSVNHWYVSFALPITFGVYVTLNIFLSVRFLKVNTFLKTSIILLLADFFLYILPLFIKVNNADIQKEIEDINFLQANFSTWSSETIEQNVHCIIFLTILSVMIIFFVVGLLYRQKTKNSKEKSLK